MPVFNRRNATLGWIALFFGKRILKRKAKAAARTTARSPRSRSRRPAGLTTRS
jgi:hypothetical protein